MVHHENIHRIARLLLWTFQKHSDIGALFISVYTCFVWPYVPRQRAYYAFTSFGHIMFYTARTRTRSTRCWFVSRAVFFAGCTLSSRNKKLVMFLDLQVALSRRSLKFNKTLIFHEKASPKGPVDILFLSVSALCFVAHVAAGALLVLFWCCRSEF